MKALSTYSSSLKPGAWEGFHSWRENYTTEGHTPTAGFTSGNWYWDHDLPGDMKDTFLPGKADGAQEPWQRSVQLAPKNWPAPQPGPYPPAPHPAAPLHPSLLTLSAN